MDGIDPTLLLSWAREDPSIRPLVLAELVKPEADLSPLVRGLLREYGPDGDVAEILEKNYRTGGPVLGSSADRAKSQLTEVRAWENDAQPEVRAWASRLMSHIGEFERAIRRWEAERYLE